MTRYAGGIFLLLVTVMVGGASLLRILAGGDILTGWQVEQFRAGHAHAGVLLILALTYLVFLERTRWSPARRRLAVAAFIMGSIGQSGGFFLNMLVGEQGTFSAGSILTVLGGVLLALAVMSLGVSLVRGTHDGEEWTV